MYTLRVLGGFALAGDTGEQVGGLSQRRAEAILAVLAVSGDLGCTRDRILGLLWPEHDETHGRHSLSVALHVIRQALGADAVLATGGTLRLNPAVIATDIQQFARSLAATPLADAVETYRGPLLDGFHLSDAPEFERWLESERARVGREYGETLERLAAAAEAGEAWPAAASWWARAVEHDPHNTRVVIRLMRALAAAGDRANALREAEAHRQRLLRELELPPEPELAAEMDRIRNSAGTLAAPATTARPATDEPPPVPADPASGTGLALARSNGPVSPETATPAVTTRPAESAVARPRRAGLRRRALAAVAVLAVAGAPAAWWWAHRPPPVYSPDVIAVLPFSAPAGRAALGAEAAHLHAIVTRDLEGNLAPVAVEPALVRKAWARAQGGDESRDPSAVDLLIARRTGAGLVLRGALDSVSGGRVLTLTVVELPRHRVLAHRSATVAPESLEAAAAHLVIEVLALEAGQPVHRLPELFGHPREVVRRFLAGARRIDLARTCRAWLADVWRGDSSLVYPGMECLHLAGPWPYRAHDAWYDTVAVHVWRHRDALVPEDRAFVNALVGPWFGQADDAETRIGLWQVATDAAPQWWLPRTHLASMLADFGPMTTIVDWRRQARSQLDLALAAGGWSRIPTLGVGLWFAVFDGDTALAYRILDAMERRARRRGNGWSTPPGTWWSHPAVWPALVDAALGSGQLAGRWLEAPDHQDYRLFFALSLGVPRTMPYADSIAVRIERAGAGDSAPRTSADGWIAWHWRARGRYDKWIEYRRRDFVFAWREVYHVLDNTSIDALFLRSALYLGAPLDTDVTRIVGRMQRIVDGDSMPTPGPGVTGIAHCWLAQWRLTRGDTTGVGRAVAYLRGLAARDRAGLLDGLPTRARWEVCPALLEALAARVTGRDALARARDLDRLLQPMPIPRRSFDDAWDGTATHDQTRGFLENLLAARLLAAAGDTAAALAASRRHPWTAVMQDMYEMPHDYFRLEGRLAAAMADTVGAVAAYRRYLALRSDPPAYPPWRAEWDSVRTELAALRPRP